MPDPGPGLQPPQPWSPGSRPPPTPLSSQILFLALLLAVVVLSMVLSPHGDGVTILGYKLPPMCLFHAITGFRCPGCGLTRSFTFMGHGQVWDAFRMHPLGPFLYLLLLWQCWVQALSVFRRLRPTGFKPRAHAG